MFDSEEFEEAFVKFCKKLLEAYLAWGDEFEEYLDKMKL
jgi:DNA-binding SARP family transcriptional activator